MDFEKGRLIHKNYFLKLTSILKYHNSTKKLKNITMLRKKRILKKN